MEEEREEARISSTIEKREVKILPSLPTKRRDRLPIHKRSLSKTSRRREVARTISNTTPKTQPDKSPVTKGTRL